MLKDEKEDCQGAPGRFLSGAGADIPIDRIAVREIAENCGYSQATFYRQFRDKYDLIAWNYTKDLEMILEQLDSSELSWRQAL